MSDNGEKVKKMCPFLGKWCIEDSCNLFIEIVQQGVNTLGIRTLAKGGMCSLPALAMILSNKPQSAPVMTRPPLIIGKG